MKNVKKLGLIFCLVILIISINTINFANTSETEKVPYIESKVEITSSEDDILETTVIIKNFKNTGEGVNAYTGFLYYDNSELELENVKAEGNWNSPTYKILDDGNSAKVVATSNEFSNKEGAIFTAIFKKKVNKESYNVKIDKFELAAKIDGTIQKVEATNLKDVRAENSKKSNEIIKKIVIILSIILIFVIVITITSEIKIKKQKGDGKK